MELLAKIAHYSAIPVSIVIIMWAITAWFFYEPIAKGKKERLSIGLYTLLCVGAIVAIILAAYLRALGGG